MVHAVAVAAHANASEVACVVVENSSASAVPRFVMESGSYAACSSRLHYISTRESAVAPQVMVLTLAVALTVHDSDVAQASPVTSIRTT